MRSSFAVAVVLVGFSVNGLAQHNNTFKAEHSTPEKVKKSAPWPVGKTTGSGTASAANSKDLQAIEHQAAGKSASSGAAGSKPSQAALRKAAPKLNPVIDQPNAKINFNATGAKKSGLVNQGSDPYKGRVRHSHQ